MTNKVRDFRRYKQLTQAHLSELSGVPQATISEIERNKRIPGVDVAIFIARALGVSVERLFIP